MNKLTITIILLNLLVFNAKLFAQTAIEGIITTEKGEYLPGVNIFIVDTYDGASSDVEGEFHFSTSERGQQLLSITMIGYHAVTREVVCDGSLIRIQVQLKEKIDQMNAVTITAGAMDAGDMKKAVVMKPLDIVTTSGALGDIIGAFNKLPGTSTVGNDGRLFVRGGDASETNIYFDGLQVGNAYGSTAANVPTRSRFNPNLFKGSFFSTGGYSAEYGQALSSALVLNSIDMPLRNQTNISLMSVGGDVTQTLVGEKNALTANAAFMNLAPYQSIIKQNLDFIEAPRNWSAEVLGRQKINDSGLLKAFVHTENAFLSLNRSEPGSNDSIYTSVQNTYHFGNISYKEALPNNWSIYGGVSISLNEDEITLDESKFTVDNSLGHAKFVIVKDFSDRFSLKNGIEYYQKYYSEANSNQKRSFEDQQSNHFVEADYYINKNLVFRTGIRTTYSSLIKQVWSSPRASLAYKINPNSQLSFAYGNFKQLPKPELQIQENKLTNTEATHFIINYLYGNNGRTFRAEAFHKGYKNLIVYDSLIVRDYAGLRNTGNGYAKGFDLFYRDNTSLDETDFWITYSFIDSERNLENYQGKVRPQYAPKHNFSAVMKRFIKPLQSQLGFSYSWNDGYTYDNPNIIGEMESKTKDYHNLSISWSYLPKPNLIIHFECSNVLGAQNEYGFNYANQPDEEGQYASQPIQQLADRFLFLGVFWTISKDKNANMLNNL